MAKKHKKFSDSNSYNAVPQPIPVSMDVLAMYSDSEINARAEVIESDMLRATNSGMDPYPWQVELAYLQREYDIRRARVATHDRYLRVNPDSYINSHNNEEQLSN